MIILRILGIYILGWVLSIYANVISEQEIKGERHTLPPSRILRRIYLLWILKPIQGIKNRFHRISNRNLRQNKTEALYILVEIIIIISLNFVYIRYGSTGKGLGAFLFIYLLIIISVIDLHTMLIPNRFILILGGFHGLFIVFGWSISWSQALLGALFGGGVLLGIRYFSLLLLKKEGMGMGDIKLAFICGLYLGPSKIMFGMLLATYISGFILLVLLIMKKVKRNQYIPYGPFLAGGFILSLLFYEDIMKIFQ